MNDEEPPRSSGLFIGTRAPLFDTKDIYGNEINLSKLLIIYNGVMIDFFRGNWWNHWKNHLTLLTDNIQVFQQRNIKLISIASDSVRLLREFKEKYNFSIDFVSDRGAKIAKKYDVYCFAPVAEKDYKVKQAIPSKFLINKEREIIWKYIGKDKTDRPSIELMRDIIDEKIKNPE